VYYKLRLNHTNNLSFSGFNNFLLSILTIDMSLTIETRLI